ncbi:MAG: exodeoxyribonuclease V subunit gamma [Myxococcales bacterium]|nr:exodeoxyribonuclease V subunit gamma [Myxococcales bacterium]
MLVVHRGNRIEALADALADVLRVPSGGPFDAECVAVAAPGLERWLELWLAHRLGICARVHFPAPAELVRAAQGDGADAWSPRRLLWPALVALDALEDGPVPVALARSRDDRHLVGLAAQVGEALARVATYRPERARAWSAGDGDEWMARVWRAVEAGVGVASPAAAALAPTDLPPRLCVFAVSTLAPLHLELLTRLAGERTVHLFALDPGDAPADHPLLSALGRLPRELAAAIGALDGAEQRVHHVDPGTDTVLRALQRDLLSGDAPRLPPDDSVQIHGCAGPLRQVEVLRDVLLDLLVRHPDLEPHHVLVMAPDVPTYAPLVEAVFADDDGGLPRLPFVLADRGARAVNPAAEALLATLDLVGGRFEASAVLDLLALPPVLRRFGLDEDDLEAVQRLVTDAGVRWGLDADHRAAHGQPGTPEHTWRFGLDRLLLGQATAYDDLVLGVLPHEAVEGKEDRAVLGALVAFVDALAAAAHALEAPRPMVAWSAALLRAVDALCAADDDTAWWLQQVRDTLTALADEAAGVDRPLDRAGVRTLLRARLERPEPGRAFLTGGVTFSGMVPLRSIPFRVVCLLGLDDGAFPRPDRRPAFDPLVREQRAGDRPDRDDDRALFLEATLAARDHLIAFYTARDPRDGAPRLPAQPLAALQDHLPTVTTDAAALQHQHPLHAFDPINFDPEAPRSFDARLRAAAEAGRGPRTAAPPFFAGPLPPPPVDGDRALTLDALIAFLMNPVRAVFGRRLGVWLGEAAEAVPDREALEPDALQRWALADDLLRRALDGHPLTDAARLRARAAGLLPPGAPGDALFTAAAGDVEPVVLQVQQMRAGGPRAPVDVDLVVGDTRLSGRVSGLWAEGHLHHQMSKVRGKHRLAAWVRHLALHASGWTGRSAIVGKDRTCVLQPLRRDPAALLESLVALYWLGQRTPLMFFPEPSETFAREVGRAGAEGAVERAFRFWGKYGEPDVYARAVLGDALPTAVDPALVPPKCDFAGLAVGVFGPLLEHLS